MSLYSYSTISHLFTESCKIYFIRIFLHIRHLVPDSCRVRPVGGALLTLVPNTKYRKLPGRKDQPV